MVHHSEAFVALDTAKLRNAVAIADAGRNGEIRYLGEIDNTETATRKLVVQLAGKYAQLTFCYEAGPTGYGLYRLIKSLGHDCMVVAPSLIPSKPGDRVKTNRRDAVNLAKLLRAGELIAVWVPAERHEAMRDLVRARDAAAKDYRIKRQNVSSFLLRCGLHFPGKKTWGRTHMNWLTSIKLEPHEQRIAFEEMLLAVRQVRERIERLQQAMRDAVPDWSLASVVEALQALRGMDMVGAIVFLAELGDLSRFENPRQLMAYLGLTPSESSTGESVKRGGITKAGNTRARRLLIEAELPVLTTPQQGYANQRRGRSTISSRDRLESPDAFVRPLPHSDTKRQTINDRRNGDRPRTVGLHLGNQPRGRGISCNGKPIAHDRQPLE